MFGDLKFENLKGKTLIAIDGKIGDDEMIFTVDNGEKYKLYHSQDWCETVDIVDIAGDLNDLIYSPILLAEEIISEEDNILKDYDYNDESHTWTFYKLSTIKGSVTIRWLGESNGYYSESVDFIKLGV